MNDATVSAKTERTALVTGASSGIGTAIAQALAEAGYHVLMTGRSPERTAGALAEVRRTSESLNVDAITCDLSAISGRRELIAAVRDRWQSLNVLVNNAGQINRTRTVTEDGMEATFAVNHLAYFQITLGLLDLLQKTGTGRIVVTASNAHVGSRLDLDDLQCERGYSGWKAYQRSKLANIMFTYEAARRWDGSGVRINAFHPGLVGTGITRQFPWPVTTIWNWIAKTPEEGARGGIRLALAPDLAGVSGKYFVGTKQKPSSPESRDESQASALWEASLQLLGIRSESGSPPTT